MTMRAALILPDLAIRNEFADLFAEHFPDLDLTVHDPLRPGEVRDTLHDIEVLFTFGPFINDELLTQATNLQWIQGLGSGVDGITDRATLSDRVLVTNARGVHGVCVSETAFALMISLARDIPKLVRAQHEHRWTAGPANLLHGRTVGILGVGLIAEGLAARCHAFGMRVEGISSRQDVASFDQLHSYNALREAMARFDYFVLLAPLTEATRNIVDASVLDAMKEGAFLINVSRGGVVDEPALIAALRRGKPAAAALDVFAVEPLEPGNELWDLPNVLISPHAGGQHHDYARHVLPILLQNMNAFQRDADDDLINVVRKPTQFSAQLTEVQ